MGKKYVCIDKVLDNVVELEERLYKYQELMEEIPNWDKSEKGQAKKVYEKGEYMVLQVKKGYIVYNSKKKFEEGHTHIRSFNICKVIINNCIKKKRPRTDNLYLLTSHIRVSDDERYKKEIAEILAAKKDKGVKKYYNKTGKKGKK